MNIKLVYAGRIDSWDTRADGSASASHAVLRVRGQNLELWSKLRFDEDYDPQNGKAQKSRSESGKAVSILQLTTPKPPQNLAGWLAAAHEELGLMRLDVDGEAIYEYEEPTEEEEPEESEKVEFFVPSEVMPNG